jgi:DJ-1 family protein
MERALVLLAEGVEEMEAVIAIDILRRCGVEVIAAATGLTREVTASRGVRLLADALLNEAHPGEFDALVIPGGAGGSRRLAGDPRVLELVRMYAKAGKLVAAVCAGPAVLEAAGVLQGVRFTCHPAAREQFPGMKICPDRVVVNGPFITSQGPGTSMEFALAVAKWLVGEEVAAKVAEGLILPPGVTW